MSTTGQGQGNATPTKPALTISEIQGLETALAAMRDRLSRGQTIEKAQLDQLARQYGEFLVHGAVNGNMCW